MTAARHRRDWSNVSAVPAKPGGRHARPGVIPLRRRWAPVLSGALVAQVPRVRRVQSATSGVGAFPSPTRVRRALQRVSSLPAFVNFAAGGAAIAVVGALLLEVLVRAGSSPLTAQAVQLTVTLALNFVYNYKVTWRDRPSTGLPRQVGWFLVTRGLTQVASWFGFAALTSLGLHYQLANGICLVGAMVVNFITSDKLVFREGKAAISASFSAQAPVTAWNIATQGRRAEQ